MRGGFELIIAEHQEERYRQVCSRTGLCFCGVASKFWKLTYGANQICPKLGETGGSYGAMGGNGALVKSRLLAQRVVSRRQIDLCTSVMAIGEWANARRRKQDFGCRTSRMEVSSKPGRGTVVTVWLPAVLV